MKFNFTKVEFDETPATIEQWYDRRTRSWVVQTKNINGDQLGNAEYFGSKQEAANEVSRLKKEYNI